MSSPVLTLGSCAPGCPDRWGYLLEAPHILLWSVFSSQSQAPESVDHSLPTLAWETRDVPSRLADPWPATALSWDAPDMSPTAVGTLLPCPPGPPSK